MEIPLGGDSKELGTIKVWARRVWTLELSLVSPCTRTFRVYYSVLIPYGVDLDFLRVGGEVPRKASLCCGCVVVVLKF